MSKHPSKLRWIHYVNKWLKNTRFLGLQELGHVYNATSVHSYSITRVTKWEILFYCLSIDNIKIFFPIMFLVPQRTYYFLKNRCISHTLEAIKYYNFRDYFCICDFSLNWIPQYVHYVKTFLLIYYSLSNVTKSSVCNVINY